MSIENFRCSVCDTVGKWKNVDEFRYKPSEMFMCEICAFITYPTIQQKSEDLTEFYRAEYREAPSVNNLFSGERKLHYHAEFLTETLEALKGKKPKVLEIGSAFGMFLRWVRQAVPDAEVFGTELTLSFRRNAWWLYQIRLDETPDWGKKYDLICSYKVAEHIPNIDKELRQYALSLTENGKLYISVPTWFGSMTNFGVSGFSLEYYYHKNHINVWSKNLFEECLRKSGLKIIKHNDTFYDDTYLCVRDDSVMSLPKLKDDPELRLVELDKIKKASSLYDLGEYEQSLSFWPDFPDAHINKYERARGKIHSQGFTEIKDKYLDPALKLCPKSSALLNFISDIYMRYEKFDEALKYLEKSVSFKPNDPSALTAIGHCYRQMSAKTSDPKMKVKFSEEARAVMIYLEKTSKQCSPDAFTWMMQDNAQMPMPFETKENEPKGLVLIEKNENSPGNTK